MSKTRKSKRKSTSKTPKNPLVKKIGSGKEAKWECQNCKRTFTTNQACDDHVKKKVCINKVPNDNFRCQYCDDKRAFYSKKSLNSHIKKKHTPPAIITNNNITEKNTDNSSVTINKISNNADVNLNQIYKNDNSVTNNYHNDAKTNITINFPPDVSKYASRVFVKVIGSSDYVIGFMEETLTNINCPQYHNIISPAQNINGKILQNGKWISRPFDYIADQIFDHFSEYMDYHINCAEKGKNKKFIEILEEIKEYVTDNKKDRSLRITMSESLSRHYTLLKAMDKKYQIAGDTADSLDDISIDDSVVTVKKNKPASKDKKSSNTKKNSKSKKNYSESESSDTKKNSKPRKNHSDSSLSDTKKNSKPRKNNSDSSLSDYKRKIKPNKYDSTSSSESCAPRKKYKPKKYECESDCESSDY